MKELLAIRNLNISLETNKGKLKAIRDLNLVINEGETVALVGESGSGKSLTAKSILRLLPNRKENEIKGEICYQHKNLLNLSEKEMRNIRGKEISMIFQDPMTSLNPTMTIGKQIMECLHKKQYLIRKNKKKQVIELLKAVGILQPEWRFKQYPHQFSGGMRQRIMIAMALASDPKLIIADEPTTALDVTTQAEILQLLKNIREQKGISVLLITHDLGVVASVADRVAVMYAGKIVEIGKVEEIFYDARHPYTWGLLRSVVTNEQWEEKLFSIPGTPPDLITPVLGDPFAPRNEYALKIDYLEEPPMFEISNTHFAATWLLHEQAPKLFPNNARQ